jgi:hypothetical protein
MVARKAAVEGRGVSGSNCGQHSASAHLLEVEKEQAQEWMLMEVLQCI